MKNLFFIPLVFLMTFCKSSKTTVSKSSESFISSVCPENGKCTIQIHKNKSLIVKSDEFGSIYHQMADNQETSIIQYEYNRTVEEGLQDGQHREEILFEINNATANISVTDKMLQSTKMLFGRHCYCKGQAGFFKVEQGTLNFKNENGTITIALDFQITKVPQLFSKVNATIK